MKLWDLKRGQRFRMPPEQCVWTFEKMDGMYARCFNERGELSIFTTPDDVEVIA